MRLDDGACVPAAAVPRVLREPAHRPPLLQLGDDCQAAPERPPRTTGPSQRRGTQPEVGRLDPGRRRSSGGGDRDSFAQAWREKWLALGVAEEEARPKQQNV